MRCIRAGMCSLLALLCWSSLATSQSPMGTLASASGTSLAAVLQQRRDDVLNPARHDGGGAALWLLVDRPRGSQSTRFDVEAFGGPLGSRFDPDIESVAAGLRVAYRRVRRVTNPDRDIGAWLGASLAGATEFAYFTNWDDSHFYWRTSYSLGFAGTIQLARSPRRPWLLEWNVPVVALVSRPEALLFYKSDNPRFGWIVSRLHHDLRLTSLNRHREVDLTLRHIRTGARFARSIFVRSEYAWTDLTDSQPLRTLKYSLGVSLGWGRADPGGR